MINVIYRPSFRSLLKKIKKKIISLAGSIVTNATFSAFSFAYARSLAVAQLENNCAALLSRLRPQLRHAPGSCRKIVRRELADSGSLIIVPCPWRAGAISRICELACPVCTIFPKGKLGTNARENKNLSRISSGFRGNAWKRKHGIIIHACTHPSLRIQCLRRFFPFGDRQTQAKLFLIATDYNFIRIC